MVFNVVLVIANKEKIAARNEPILPADLAMLSVAKQLLGMVDLKIWLSFAIFLILLIFIITWLEIRRVVAVKFSRGQRIFYLLFAPLIFLSSTIWNQPNTPINNFLSAIDDQPMFYNQLSGAKINGPILQYLNNVDVTVMKQPSGYSQKAMVKIVQRYGKEAAKINETRDNAFMVAWGHAYYFSNDGVLLRNQTRQINGVTYRFNNDGVITNLKNQFITDHNGKVYYFDQNGQLYVNKFYNNWGHTYYFGKDGARFTNQWYRTVGAGDNYYFGADGAALTGSQKLGKFNYYFKDNGLLDHVNS